VGRHLVAGLLAEGAPVRALTRRPATAGLPAGAQPAPFDPGRPETIEAALAGTQAIFLNATAIGSVLAPLLTWAGRAGVRRAVLLSSMLARDPGYAVGAQHKALEHGVATSGQAELRARFAAAIELGLQFRDARAAKGWSQRELSERSGVRQADISRIERGAGNPRK